MLEHHRQALIQRYGQIGCRHPGNPFKELSPTNPHTLLLIKRLEAEQEICELHKEIDRLYEEITGYDCQIEESEKELNGGRDE